MDSVLDVVRKEAESCDCLQVNYQRNYTLERNYEDLSKQVI